MGTYTANYQLYMPSIGETGWGTLINGNYQTIDTTMKDLSNRITAVENEVNGALNCASVTASGKITGNGGIAGTTGTFSGAVTASNLSNKVLTPVKLYLSNSTSTPVSQYSYGAVYEYLASPNASAYGQVCSTGNIPVHANSSLTVKFLPAIISGGRYQFSNLINVSGSWGYYINAQLVTNTSIKITNSAGVNRTIPYSTNAYTSISQDEFIKILTNVNTVTATNNSSQYYQYFSLSLYVKNNNTGSGTVYVTNYDYL